jgi:hypothetical protein
MFTNVTEKSTLSALQEAEFFLPETAGSEFTRNFSKYL